MCYICICDAQHFQSQFIEKGFKKTENFEQYSVVLLLFLFTLGLFSWTYSNGFCHYIDGGFLSLILG